MEFTMSSDLYKAALKGDINILPSKQVTGDETAAITISRSSNEVKKYFLSYTTSEERNTILHIAARNHGNLNFIEKVVKIFPTLIGQKNYRGETALHVSARHGNEDITKFLVAFCGDIEDANNTGGKNDSEPMWKVKNSEGDTALHTAIKSSKTKVALFLVRLDNSLASCVNDFGETPLHLAVKICTCVGASNNGLINQLSSRGDSLREDMVNILHLLLKIPSSAVFSRDRDGLTPLLRAAYSRSCIPIISFLIDDNPQLIDQRDFRGRTLLHLIKIETYQEGKMFLEKPEINALKNEQDFGGDTPLHVAVKNSEFMKARVLMECLVDFNIINSYGISSWELIQSQEDFVTKMKDETDKAMNVLMDKQLYRATVRGDVQFLSQHDDIYFLSRSNVGNNILHIALYTLGSDSSNKATHFVVNVLERFPILLYQTNDHGDTPLHLAAMIRDLAVQKLILFCKDAFQKALDEGASFLYCSPIRVRNSEGNTPLHEALRAGNVAFACFLMQVDNDVASFVNNCNETPLHVYARYQKKPPGPLFNFVEEAGSKLEAVDSNHADELDLLLEANISAAFSRDVDGLTPLLRAAQCSNVEIIKRILGCCPSSAEICDSKGRTLVHLMPVNDKTENLLGVSHIKALIEMRDYDGNTPLHTAIKKCHFNKVKVLLKHASKGLLDAVNSDGESPIDLIHSQTRVPNEILEDMWNLSPVPKSIYGISETEMKVNVNILLVVAVLLGTITFSACFTIPGGYDDNGTPILIKKAAFKIYLISDTYAMCCSMMALFSLIWFMTRKTSESLKLVDLSMFVLQQAFYGTTVAFMTGVYVSISLEALWTAILVCIFCCGLILCSFKPLLLLCSRTFSDIHDALKNVATNYAWIPGLSCVCSALLSGSRLEARRCISRNLAEVI